MKPIRTFSILLLLILLLLTGCSIDALAERGAGVLDGLFAGERIQSAAPESDPEPAPEVPQAEEPEVPQAEEPEISDPMKPVVPDSSGDPPPVPSAPEDPEQSAPVPSAPSAEVTPSHTDVTFFSSGESFRYLPEGVSGIYACSYASDDDTVASVDPDTGRVTAVGPGMTKVKMHVEYNGQYDFSCIVRCNWQEDGKKDGGKTGNTSGKKEQEDEPVLPPAAKPETPASVDGISASHSDATFFNPKEHFRLLPVGAGDDCAVGYSTSNSDVASVDKKGTVTAVGPGTAAVTMVVDCGGSEYSFECIVRCNW